MSLSLRSVPLLLFSRRLSSLPLSSLRSLLVLGLLVAASVRPAAANEGILDVARATFKLTNPTSTATGFVVIRRVDPVAQTPVAKTPVAQTPVVGDSVADTPKGDAASPKPGSPASSSTDGGTSELILVTAAHVFERMQGDKCIIVLRHQAADGTFQRREVPLAVRAKDKPLWVRHPKMDVAALKLTPPENGGIDGVPLEQIADEATVRAGTLRATDPVYIPCYPAQLEASPAGFPILRRGMVASIAMTPIVANPTFLLDFNTFAGDSGSPVIMSNRETSGKEPPRPTIVGIVVGQHHVTAKTVTQFEQRTVLRPLGLAIAIHAEYIRQTIDRLSN